MQPRREEIGEQSNANQALRIGLSAYDRGHGHPVGNAGAQQDKRSLATVFRGMPSAGFWG
jgi:hypothetical protein